MPTRIASVFSIEKSGEKGKVRFNTLCGFDYSNEELGASEKVPLTPFAPCIENSEMLARTLDDPTHVEIELGLAYTPAAFADAFKWGLSVQRLSMASKEQIDEFGINKAQTKGRKYLGYVAALADNIRKEFSVTSNKRLFGIYATASEEAPSHADIYAVTNSPEDRETAKAVFWILFDLDSLTVPATP